MQRCFADDFFPVQHEQRQIALEIGVAAPFLEQCPAGNRLLDEEALLLRHREKKFVQAGGIPLAQRAHDAFRAVPQFQFERKFFQSIIEHHKRPFVA